MSAPDVIRASAQLAAGGDALIALVRDAGAEESVWRRDGTRWSLCEILGHLIDEEKDDFRARLKLLLDSPANPWPVRDPEQNVRDGDFNARALADLVAEFAAERKRSVAWVASIRDAAWTNTYRHPSAGPLSAAGLLHNWIAHDLLHVRQIVTLRFAWLRLKAEPDDLDYAGPW